VHVLDIGKIDIVMPTWNSNKWWFPSVLDSIMKNCDICHLIIVDRDSHDGTIETLKKTIPQTKLKIIESDCNLAQARQIGISTVDTKIFAFVDSDIELCQNWQAKMSFEIQDDKIGAVQGNESDIYEARNTNPEVKELIPLSSVKFGRIIKHGLFNLIRGLTTQTLLRTDLVSDWKPSASLCSFEDYSLTQHVLSKGNKWIRADGVVSRHHKYPEIGKSKFDLVHKWYLWIGAGAKISGIPIYLIVLNSLSRTIGASLRFFRRKVSVDQMFFIILMQVSILQGFIFSKKYLVSYR
jgi:glycosyltransferase involved in cell wall biosynthesis